MREGEEEGEGERVSLASSQKFRSHEGHLEKFECAVIVLFERKVQEEEEEEEEMNFSKVQGAIFCVSSRLRKKQILPLLLPGTLFGSGFLLSSSLSTASSSPPPPPPPPQLSRCAH